ncbi:TPA: hypothetical protein ROG05_001517 [Enterobacter soli]|nr:hypothetical protein [Enterobacter soli]
MDTKNRLKAVNLLPCGGSTPGWQICGKTPTDKNFAPEIVSLQSEGEILRSAFLFRMKINVTSLLIFCIPFESTTLLLGLLRWCSNQSPGPGAVLNIPAAFQPSDIIV